MLFASVFNRLLFHTLHSNVAIICSKYFSPFNLMLQRLFCVVASVIFKFFMLLGQRGASRADESAWLARGLVDGGARGQQMQLLWPRVLGRAHRAGVVARGHLGRAGHAWGERGRLWGAPRTRLGTCARVRFGKCTRGLSGLRGVRMRGVLRTFGF